MAFDLAGRHPRHMCTGTDLIPATSAPGLGSAPCRMLHVACHSAGGSAVVCGKGPGSFLVYDTCSNATRCQIAVTPALRKAAGSMCGGTAGRLRPYLHFQHPICMSYTLRVSAARAAPLPIRSRCGSDSGSGGLSGGSVAGIIIGAIRAPPPLAPSRPAARRSSTCTHHAQRRRRCILRRPAAEPRMRHALAHASPWRSSPWARSSSQGGAIKSTGQRRCDFHICTGTGLAMPHLPRDSPRFTAAALTRKSV
jgi:hypothetical protein